MYAYLNYAFLSKGSTFEKITKITKLIYLDNLPNYTSKPPPQKKNELKLLVQ